MSLTWKPKQKKIAKEGGKALIKFQAQLKHCGGGNYRVTGPASKKRALAMFVLGCLSDSDPKVDQAFELLCPEPGPKSVEP